MTVLITIFATLAVQLLVLQYGTWYGINSDNVWGTRNRWVYLIPFHPYVVGFWDFVTEENS